jgi:hypothetical protein
VILDPKKSFGNDGAAISFIELAIKLGTSSALLVLRTYPSLYFNSYLELRLGNCSLSSFRMDVVSTRRTPPISGRANYDFKLADNCRASHMACIGARRKPPNDL